MFGQQLIYIQSNASNCIGDILAPPLALHQGARTFSIESGNLDWDLPMVQQAPSLARRRHPETSHRLCRWLAPTASLPLSSLRRETHSKFRLKYLTSFSFRAGRKTDRNPAVAGFKWAEGSTTIDFL